MMVESRIHAAECAAERPAVPGYGELVQEASHDIATLVRLEVSLAKEEITLAAKKQLRAIVFMAVGGLFWFANFVMLAWGAIYAIALFLPLWASVLIVAGAGSTLGLVVFLIGRAELDPSELRPDATIETTRNSVRYLANRVRTAQCDETPAQHAAHM